jgi:hypothetical protein
MAQFDVYKNTNSDTSQLFPYLLDIQNNILSACGDVVENLEEKRSEIINALDFLISGF